MSLTIDTLPYLTNKKNSSVALNSLFLFLAENTQINQAEIIVALVWVVLGTNLISLFIPKAKDVINKSVYLLIRKHH